MIVPTGSARVATSTSGPAGLTGAATACGAEAPLNMFFAMTAVTAAMMSAPISSASFLTSMASVASPTGTERDFRAYSSAKLVKKTLANQPQSAERDRHAVRNLQLRAAAGEPVADQHRQRQRAAGERH